MADEEKKEEESETAEAPAEKPEGGSEMDNEGLAKEFAEKIAEAPDEGGVSKTAEDAPLPQASAPLESTSSFALKDEAVLKEIAEADAKAQKTASLVEHLREAIAQLTQKENLTEQDAIEIQNKQAELMEQLAELEAVSKRIQNLLGLEAVSSSGLGPPYQCKDYGVFADPCQAVKQLKTPNLPKVIICGNESQSQIPKIIVCDPLNKKDAKIPVFQQYPGRPQSEGEGPSMKSPCVDRGGMGVDASHGFVPGPGGLFSQGVTGQGAHRGQPGRDLPGQQRMMGPQMMMGNPGMLMGQQRMMGPQMMIGNPGMLMGQQRMMGPQMMMGNPGMLMGQQRMMGNPEMLMGPQMMMGNPGMVMGQQRVVGPQGMTGQPGMMMRPQRQEGTGGMVPQGGQYPSNAQPSGAGMMGGNQSQAIEEEGPENLTPDEMQKRLLQLKAENKNLASENTDLKKKLASPTGLSKGGEREQPMCKRMLASSGPACRLDTYRAMGLPYPGLGVGGDASTHDMETMVASMEEEVLCIKKELDSVQAERRALELQRKLLQCAAPNVAKGPTKIEGCTSAPAIAEHPSALPPSPPGMPMPGGNGLQMQLQLRELREQYNKLQQDYRCKVEEVSLLRVELEGAKRESLVSIEKTEEAEAKVDDLLERLRAVEAEKQKITITRDQMIELEQQLIMAKQRYRESSEEAEEVKAQLNDQIMQVEEYREKYLKAQETVEEQRRQLDLTEMESNRFGEQVALEIQRVKAQFQAKLEELTPLPEMLKKSQEKLKEALHLKALAEKNVMIMSRNLEAANEQKEKIKKQLDEISRNKMASEAEKASLQGNLTDGEKKMEETKAENAKLKVAVSRLEEAVLKKERKLEEKVHEVLQLESQLETLREESARQVSRTKDRCENIRRTLLGQISELERQLAAARAIAKAAQKDRDDIRQKMQAQITHLNDNFDQAQTRIRNLQSHVNYLKNSYTNIIAPLDVPISIDKLYPDENT